METIQGWDVYGHNYEYDEVKVIAMLHKALVDRNWFPDWENVLKVGHWIYGIYVEQVNGNKQAAPKPWMEIQGREEFAYIQAWFSRTVEDFIDYYKKSFNYFNS